VAISHSDVNHDTESGYSPTFRAITKVPCGMVIKRMWKEFKYVYTNPYTLKWSIWWALNSCGFYQEGTYAQTLWQHMTDANPDEAIKYTGLTDSAYTIFGAAAAFASGYVTVNGDFSSDILMGTCAVLEGSLVLWASQSGSLIEAYISHILFAGVFYFSSSIGYSEIAKNIPSDCFALVFGLNTFVALLIQTFLTFCFSARGGLEFASRTQFIMHGTYFLLLGFAFLFKCIYSCLKPHFVPLKQPKCAVVVSK